MPMYAASLRSAWPCAKSKIFRHCIYCLQISAANCPREFRVVWVQNYKERGVSSVLCRQVRLLLPPPHTYTWLPPPPGCLHPAFTISPLPHLQCKYSQNGHSLIFPAAKNFSYISFRWRWSFCVKCKLFLSSSSFPVTFHLHCQLPDLKQKVPCSESAQSCNKASNVSIFFTEEPQEQVPLPAWDHYLKVWMTLLI